MNAKTEWRYDRLTWPQIKDAIGRTPQPVVADVLDANRRGGPGSVGHACEYETAMMLHALPEYVQMDKARRDIGQLKLKYFNWDYPEPSAYAYQAWWSTFTKEGVCGDAA